MYFSTLVIPALGLASVVVAAPATKVKRDYDASACNNFPSLCDKSYADIVHLGAHNSPFVRNSDNGYSLAGNQFYNVKTQLDAGVRLIQGQVHDANGEIRLCHTKCELFDGGLLVDYLKDVKSWLDAHPSDVVTILLVNAANFPATKLKAVFDEATLSDLAFVPSAPLTPKTWPTLRTLIDAKKRLVSFISTTADEKAVPFLLDEFSYIFETPFEVFDAKKFVCTGDRPSSVSGQDKLKEAVDTRLGFMNRFLGDLLIEGTEVYMPKVDYVATLNSDNGDGNLKTGIETCEGEWGRKGGFAMVDFFDQGPAIKVVDAANGVTNPVNRVDPPANHETADKSLTAMTSSAGKLSKVADKAQDIVDDAKNAVKDVTEKVDVAKQDVVGKVDEAKKKVDDAGKTAEGIFGKVKSFFGIGRRV
ncbi:hypothetical protein RUND412_002356 [Rhizina undulata]